MTSIASSDNEILKGYAYLVFMSGSCNKILDLDYRLVCLVEG